MENLLDESKLNTLQLNNQSKAFLKEIAKWTGFLAIIGFIGIGLMIIMAFSMGAILGSLPMLMGEGSPYGMIGGGFLTFLYLLMALLYFFPVYYLFKFSRNLKLSLANENDNDLTKAFEYLKSHYKFIGILTIVILSIYALIFVFALIAGVASM